MPASDDLDITFDFSTAQHNAERVREMLLALRRQFDLAQFEYCKQICIAPTEIPHSHPRITLNTWVRDDLALASTYLHEQMHWYATWFSHVHPDRWQRIFQELRRRYQNVPVGGEDGARDEFSTYLHLLVNWLEVEATSRLFDRERIVRHVLALPFYRWAYRTAIDDWQPLGALFADEGVVPIRAATDMSMEDLRLAALADEAPT